MTSTTMLRRARWALVLPVILLAACGGSGEASNDDVATLSDGAAGNDAATETTVAGDLEEQYLAWQQCMAGEGVDVPDLTVDADGNPQIAPPAGGGGGGGAGAEDGGPAFDREAVETATEVCGEIPEGVFGGDGSPADNQEFQDTLLEFAQCMRDNGVDVPDPDFSAEPGGDEASAGAGGPFGGAIDQDDPAVQAAMDACESILSDIRPGGAGSDTTTAG